MSIKEREITTQIISPVEEIVSYETLWTIHSSVKRIAEVFKEFNHALPSDVIGYEGIIPIETNRIKNEIEKLLPFRKFSALFYGDFEYPRRLGDAQYPVEILYYQGALDLLSSPSVAVVGARKATEEGLKRAKKVTQLLVENDYTVMSGLAEGIDTAAHKAAIEAGGKTIAVIGTALHTIYPRSNIKLQKEIAEKYLLVSQVPFYQSSRQNYRINKNFFLERNKTMSALSLATIIVEASETSGTLVQAKAAFQQGRKLFILNSCFERNLQWPESFLKQGAIRIRDSSQLLEELHKLKNGD